MYDLARYLLLKQAMRRFLIILVLELTSIFSFAQVDDMFRIERTYEVADADQYELDSRAKSWTEFAQKYYRTIYDYRFKKPSRALDFYYVYRYININGVDIRTNYNFSIVIYSNPGAYTVALEHLHVSAYKGRWNIMCAQELPMDEESFTKGDFSINRNLQLRRAISKEVKQIVSADFEYILPSIESYMSNR